MKKIAIYGIGGLYNFGCEAILRGTVEYIRKTHNEEIIITYYSKRPKDDTRITNELNIKMHDLSSYSPPLLRIAKRCISKIIDVFQIPVTPFRSKEYDTVICQSDEIYSIGGDIYTIPKYLRKKKKYRYVNSIVEFGERALKEGKTLIIYGASIGPFGRYKKAIEYYSSHLKKVDKIICRESISVKYLNSIGVSENVQFLPDPAFLVKDHPSYDQKTSKYIGINLSELSLQEVYGQVSDKEINIICSILHLISKEVDLPIMLIPHVLSPHTIEDNDYTFLSKIATAMLTQYNTKVTLCDVHGFIDAKKYLRQCKFLISARMHCAINAIIEGIPAIFLSYSQKSIGMSRFIYGTEKWCIPLEEIESRLLIAISELNNDYDAIVDSIINKNIEIEKLYSEYFNSVK